MKTLSLLFFSTILAFGASIHPEQLRCEATSTMSGTFRLHPLVHTEEGMAYLVSLAREASGGYASRG